MPTIIQMIPGHVQMAAMTPGAHINDEIKKVIKYCKDNNVTATFEFNGTSNSIDQYSDVKFLVENWYHMTKESVAEYKQRVRNEKINSILK